MKVVILAGGRGTRITEETNAIPKPMVEVGGKPVLWHIMKMYSHFGYNDFIICLGYKGYMIKEYFSHYFLHVSDVTIDLAANSVITENSASEPWKITLVDTGLDTMTGGRLKRVEKYLNKESFMLTYGDGVSNVDIKNLVKFHKTNKFLATVTAVQPTGRFGSLDITEEKKVGSFLEKPPGDGSWINAGFFVFGPEIFNYIYGDDVVLEKEPLEKVAASGQLAAFKHRGFWKCMDTLRDKIELEGLWQSGKPPWKLWE